MRMLVLHPDGYKFRVGTLISENDDICQISLDATPKYESEIRTYERKWLEKIITHEEWKAQSPETRKSGWVNWELLNQLTDEEADF